MAPRKLYKTFDIVENPWWRVPYTDPQGVGDLIKSIGKLNEVLKKQKEIIIKDPYWKGYVDVHHTKYLLECITGETNDSQLTYYGVESMVRAGCLRMLWNYLFHRRTYRTMRKVQNLNRAATAMFPNICLFKPSPLENLNIEFVRNLHQQVGKTIILNAGKFRTKNAKPAQENFEYLRPDLIESRLENLLKECRQVFAEPNLELTDAIKYGACFLSEFLFIHPFSNGNGRVGRLLLSYLLTNYTVVPLSLYSSNSARDTYLQCLRETREFHPEFDKPGSLSRFILENIERELRDLHYLMDMTDDVNLVKKATNKILTERNVYTKKVL